MWRQAITRFLTVVFQSVPSRLTGAATLKHRVDRTARWVGSGGNVVHTPSAGVVAPRCRRERQRKHDGCNHANGDEQGVKAEQVAQLVGEHAVDCLGQQADLRQRSAAEGGRRRGTAIKSGGANRGAGCGAFTLRIRQKVNRAVSEKLQAFAN